MQFWWPMLWQDWAALLSLSVMELALGIDNFVILEALVARLPHAQRQWVWGVGALLAMLLRIGLLATVTHLVWMKTPWSFGLGLTLSLHAVMLGLGGVFLIYKGLSELIQAASVTSPQLGGMSIGWVLWQIVVMDLLLSLDSVFTAVGLSQQFWIMASSVVLSTLVVIGLRARIRAWLDARPSLRLLVWAMLIVIGVSLVAEACDVELPKWILYAVIAAGWLVEQVLTRIRKGVRN
jgi:predicted tellurium resistance membrane protein TerC